MIIAKSSNKKKLGCEQEVVKNGLTQMRINESDLDEFEKISCDLDLGDIVLFTFDTAHKTGINHSGKPRINSICRYSNAKTKFGENPFYKNRDKWVEMKNIADEHKREEARAEEKKKD